MYSNVPKYHQGTVSSLGVWLQYRWSGKANGPCRSASEEKLFALEAVGLASRWFLDPVRKSGAQRGGAGLSLLCWGRRAQAGRKAFKPGS